MIWFVIFFSGVFVIALLSVSKSLEKDEKNKSTNKSEYVEISPKERGEGIAEYERLKKREMERIEEKLSLKNNFKYFGMDYKEPIKELDYYFSKEAILGSLDKVLYEYKCKIAPDLLNSLKKDYSEISDAGSRVLMETRVLEDKLIERNEKTHYKFLIDYLEFHKLRIIGLSKELIKNPSDEYSVTSLIKVWLIPIYLNLKNSHSLFSAEPIRQFKEFSAYAIPLLEVMQEKGLSGLHPREVEFSEYQWKNEHFVNLEIEPRLERLYDFVNYKYK